MRKTIYNWLRVRPCITLLLRTGNATTSGVAVPLNYNSQQFRNAMLVFVTGTITDGNLAVTIEESPDGSTAWTAIPVGDRLLGALPATTATDDDKIYEVGIIPDPLKPFLRCTAVQSAATTGGTFGAYILLSGANQMPVIRP